MKRSICILTALLLSLYLTVCVFASGDLPTVVDNSGLLTSQEVADLEKIIGTVSSDLGIDIVILTTDSLDGKSAMAYADDYYDYNGYGEDGVLLLVSMTEREWWISTCGSCIWAINADRLGELFVPYLSSGNYYTAFSTFVESCGSAMDAEADDSYKEDLLPDDWYEDDYYEPAPKEESFVIPILVCLGIGAVVGLIVVLVMKGQLRSVRAQSGAGSYIRAGSMHLTQQTDRFLYQNVTRRAKPQNNNHSGPRSGGGRGGFHISSSGRSHGGGGGRF